MKKKISLFLFALLVFFPAAVFLSACGESEAKATEIVVQFANNQYAIENNQITMEWGEYISLTDQDFTVKVNFDDGTSKVVNKKTAQKDGYTLESDLPELDDLADGKTPIGEYEVTISYGELDNYVITISITKKNVVLSNFEWNGTNFVYDGTEKVVEITNQLPEYLEVIYENNTKTDVGDYTATANFVLTDDVHYVLAESSATHDWHITKANVDVSTVDLVQKQFTYDGEEIAVKLNNAQLPAGVSAEIISGGVATNAGSYEAVVRFTVNDNYNVPQDKVIAWNIAKANVDVSAVDLAQKSFTYNGSEFAVGLNSAELPAGVTAQIVSGANATNAGTYRAVVRFTVSGNYNVPQDKTIVWNIAKADTDVSAVDLTQKQFTYNGSEFAVKLNSADLPAGVSAQIVSGRAATNAGSYQAVVRFVVDANHNELEDKVIDWNIAKASLTVAVQVDAEVVCGNDVNATYIATGFVGNDDAGVLKGTPVYNYGGYDKNNCGDSQQFTVSVSGLSADNYEIAYQTATFTTIVYNFSAVINGQTQYYKSLSVFEQSGTYKLLRNASYQTLVFGSEEASNLEVVLDLGYYQLTCDGQDVENSIYVDENSTGNTITIKNGTINGQNAQNVIYVNGNNKFNLINGLTIQSNNNAVKLDGANAEVNSTAYIEAEDYAVYSQDAKLNITDGSYNGAIYLNGGNVSISGGWFYGDFIVEGLKEFITGGSYNYEILEDWVPAHYKIVDYGEYYVYALPDVVDIELVKNYYIAGVDTDIADFEVKIYYQDQSQETKTVGELHKLISTEFDGDVEQVGKHTLTLSYDNLIYPDVIKEIEFETVEVVSVDSENMFVSERNDIYNFYVVVKLSNNVEYRILLSDCVDAEQLENFEQAMPVSQYDFDVNYGTYNGNLLLEIAQLNVSEISFVNSRQYYQNKDSMIEVQFNNGDEKVQYSLYDSSIVVTEILDESSNSYTNFDQITEPGFYYITAKILLDEVYDETSQEYVPVYSDEATFTLNLVGDDAISSFDLETSDVLVGETPKFGYSTFAGNWVSGDETLFAQLNFISGEVNINVAGKYTAKVEYEGIVRDIVITVHNPEDARYLSLNGNYIIDGKNSLSLSGEYWNGDSIEDVDFDFDMIIGGTYDLTQKGEYQVVIEYAGLRQLDTLYVVNGEDFNYFYLEKIEIELNSTDPIMLAGWNYLDRNVKFELTPEMITDGNAPDLTKVGVYNFEVTYMGYSTYLTLVVYDPTDMTLTGIEWISSNSIVWLYDSNNGNIQVNPNIDGLYIRAEYANRTKQVIKVTREMISFSEDQARQSIQGGSQYPMINFTISYQDKKLYGSAVMLTEDTLNYIATICDDIQMTKEGQQLYTYEGLDIVPVELGHQIEGYALKYYYQGYNYYLELTENNILNSDNQPQDFSQAGAYEVSVNGYNFALIIYDMADAELDAHFNDSVYLVENSTIQDLLDAILGQKMSVRYEFEYKAASGTEYNYSFYEYFNLERAQLGDLSTVDLTKVGTQYVPFTYNGEELTAHITINPDVSGQEPKRYTMNLYGSTEVDMYDEYIKIYSSYYKYRVIDAENHIIGLTTFVIEELYVVDDTTHTITKFMPSKIYTEETPRTFQVLFGDDETRLVVYQDKYAEIYVYDDNENDFVYESTMMVEIEDVDGVIHLSCEYGRFVSDADGNLSMEVYGELAYEYEMAMEGQQMRAELRIHDNGNKVMYYFVKVGDEYLPQGTMTWEINEEGTLIDCYLGEFKAISFIVEDGAIVGILN